MIVTIDGPAGSGKSTVAQLLAKRLDASYLDTGAMYRAVTLAALQLGVDMTDELQLLQVLDKTDFKFRMREGKIFVAINGLDVTERIREREVTANARYAASAEKIRARLVQMQRNFALGQDKIVTEGRDQGTVAFDDADFKFFLKAEETERARRRMLELQEKGVEVTLEQVQKDIENRDKSDRNRNVGPLKPADDAKIIDTTDMSVEEVVVKLLSYIEEDE